MTWRKRGLIYGPNGEFWWNKRGAQLPTVEVLPGAAALRVYFASKDAQGFGRIGSVDLDFNDPQRVLHVAPEPALDIGALGTFDDCGVVPNSVITFRGRRHLYYQGFQRAERVPYLTFTGLAVETAAGAGWVKHAPTPIMDRIPAEPFIRSTPCVLADDGLLKMWYVSTPRWEHDEHGVHYICVVRYATSTDGVHWEPHAHVCLRPDLADEYAVGRPAVVRDGDLYRMWYSIRSFKELYTIGYAESADGIVWERKDAAAGITKSATGWDAEMICYPAVVTVNGQCLLFYNGNGRGVSGFGYAVWEA